MLLMLQVLLRAHRNMKRKRRDRRRQNRPLPLPLLLLGAWWHECWLLLVGVLDENRRITAAAPALPPALLSSLSTIEQHIIQIQPKPFPPSSCS